MKYRVGRDASLLPPAAAGAPQADVAVQNRAPAGAEDPKRAAAQPVADSDIFDTHDDGFGEAPFATARGMGGASDGPVAGPAGPGGLTTRQLRMVRRVAKKHGLTAATDQEAVDLLKARGIDPFDRSAMLDLVVADDRLTGGALTEVRPAQRSLVPKPPTPEKISEEVRAREILQVQRDIARRRRRRTAMLLLRLAFFVALPTAIAGYYYYQVATPLYVTRSEFLIQKADAGGGGMLGSLFTGTSLATQQDAITVQGYLDSRDAMQRLDRETGFKAHFSQGWIDPILRLSPDASDEAAYRLYQTEVRVGYDPSEGVVKMEVAAADPETSRRFSQALIGFAEEQVDALSKRLRDDQMQGAHDSYAEAERKVDEAQARVLDLQERLGVLDPVSESSSLMSQITAFEVELQKKRLELQQLLDNASPNRARVEGARGDIQRLENLVAGLRAQLTSSAGNTTSLASISGQLKLAETELQTRELMLQQALTQLETARIEANKQVRYLAVGVNPVAPDRPTYPRRFEDTLLAFLIFSGIYLMLSLTASILREQVSA